MLKLGFHHKPKAARSQPPSGGCVLKPFLSKQHFRRSGPAAFGRLCVETMVYVSFLMLTIPAAFGRLCVETSCSQAMTTAFKTQPPSGGCVLKHAIHCHGGLP